MANRRMLSRSISTSKKLNRVSDRAALIYSWGIPQHDDYGDLDGSIELIRGTIVPLRKYSDRQILEAKQELCNVGAWIPYMVDGEEYIHVVNYEEHQTFKNDRPKEKRFPIYDEKHRIPLDSIGIQEDSHNRSEYKGMEGKRNLADESAPKKISPNPLHKKFLDWYYQTADITRHVKIKITGAANKNLKAALKNQSFEELQKRAVYYLCHISFQGFSPGLETFLSAGIQNGLANRAKNDKDYWKDIERFSTSYIPVESGAKEKLDAMKLVAFKSSLKS